MLSEATRRAQRPSSRRRNIPTPISRHAPSWHLPTLLHPIIRRPCSLC